MCARMRKRERGRERKGKFCRTTEYTNSVYKGKNKTMRVMREKEIVEKEKALMEKQAQL